MRVEDLIRPLVERVKDLKTRVEQVPVIRWGVVSQTSPLMVALDGSIDTTGSPVSAPARSAIGGLLVGARVLCVEQHRRVIVVQVNKLIDWTPPTFMNSFGNGVEPARVEVTPYRVEFSGALYRSSAPTAFTTAFMLPAGVPRPKAQVRSAGRDDDAMWTAITAEGEVQIKANTARSTGIGYMLDGVGYAY
jgi:hypothetical protein